jgi:hypothetical protein
MELKNLQKQSSEVSDDSNWIKKILIENTPFKYNSIEGCNQNNENKVTHLFERAKVIVEGNGDFNLDNILKLIIELETKENLENKIEFAKCFGIPLSYILYCDENENVFTFELDSSDKIRHIRTDASYKEFSVWIQSVKGWKSGKYFREGLPNFDTKLRDAGCAWPTNIDCFICNEQGQPVGILEFQNADVTGVQAHCNNDFFLCKIAYKNKHGYINYHDDVRRWLSQEILRLQSNLRLFVITWTKKNKSFVFKQIEKITFPDFPYANDWKAHGEYRDALHQYTNLNKSQEQLAAISKKYESYNLSYSHSKMNKLTHSPTLSLEDKTFPNLYYTFKDYDDGKTNNENKLIEMANMLF